MAFKGIVPKPNHFIRAALYRKTALLKASACRVADHDEIVETVIDGHVETVNIAHAGDVIVTGPRHERYVLPAATFAQVYERDPNHAGCYRSRILRSCLFLTENISFDTAWQQKQFIAAGGVLVRDGEHVYGIEKDAFLLTYARADHCGEVLVEMNEELRKQKILAQAFHEHLLDIAQRETFFSG